MPIAAYMAENSRATAIASSRRLPLGSTNTSARKKPRKATLATASHLSCWRCWPLARRNRTASDATESVKVRTYASTTTLPASLADSHPTSSPGAPVRLMGLWTNGKS